MIETGRPPTFETPEALQAAIDSYFNYEGKEGFEKIMELAKGKIEAYYEHEALHGNVDKTMAIFTLKANCGWRDRDDDSNKGTTIIIQDKGKEVVDGAV
jgi:phosphosulfolactate synthase (CoM biosynthesis protein A)